MVLIKMKITELQYADEYPNMTLRGCMVLLVLRHGAMDFSEMARKLGLLKSALSRALDMLGHYGLTDRERDEHDMRCLNVKLTVKGRKVSEFIGG